MATEDYNEEGLLKTSQTKNANTESSTPAWAEKVTPSEKQDDEFYKSIGLSPEEITQRAADTNDLGLNKTINHYVHKTGEAPDQGVDGSMAVRGGLGGGDLHKAVQEKTGIAKGTMKNARAAFGQPPIKKKVSDNVYLYTTRHESVKGQCTGFTFELECQKGVAVAFTLDLSNCENLIFVDGQVKCTKTVPKFTRVVINEAKRMNPARGFSLKLKMGIKEVKPAAWQQFEDEVFDDSDEFGGSSGEGAPGRGGPPPMPGKNAKGGPPPAPAKPKKRPTKESIVEKKKKVVGHQKIYETNAAEWDPEGQNDVLYDGKKGTLLSLEDGTGMVQYPGNDGKNKLAMVPEDEIVYVNKPGDAPPEGYGINLVKCIHDYEGAEEGELAIDPGDIIQVFDEDPSGWWEGQAKTNLGVFPSNYVEKYKPVDSDYYCAIYAYEAQNPGELSFPAKETILVINKDEGGWWEGIYKGSTGIFPSEYVRPPGTEETKTTETDAQPAGEQLIQRDGYNEPELISEATPSHVDVIKTTTQAAYTKNIGGLRIDPRSGRTKYVKANEIFKSWQEEDGLDLTAVPAGVRGAYADPTNETMDAGLTAPRKLQVRTNYENPNEVEKVQPQKFSVLEGGQEFDSVKHVPDVIVAPEEGGGNFHPLASLQNQPFPSGVDPMKREQYLNETDFQAAFGMAKDAWGSVPGWKQQTLKRSKGLF